MLLNRYSSVDFFNPRILAFLLFFGIFNSCKTSRPVYTEPTPPPKIEEPKEADPEILSKEAEEVEPEIEEKRNIHDDTGPQSTLNMALLIPFMAESYYPGESKIPQNSERFLNFYQGFLLGVERLQKEGLHVSAEVYDTENSDDVFDNKMNKINPESTDIVIGAYKSSNIKKLASWSGDHQTVAISPWKSSNSVSRDNPYFLQINPTLDTYFESIIQHVYTHFEHKQIFLVGRDEGKSRIDKLQNIGREVSKEFNYTPFRELIITEALDSIRYEDFNYNFNSSSTPVFVIPYYRNESFVHNFLGKLASIADGRKVIVYGMPNWRNFNSVEYTQLAHLRTRLPCYQHIDISNMEVANFLQLYNRQYGMIPTHDDAYMGYDLALFVGRSFRDHGSDFLLDKDGGLDKMSTTWFGINRSVPNSPSGSEDYDRINFFENTGIRFLNFSRTGISVTE